MPKKDLFDCIFSDIRITKDAIVLDVGCGNSGALCYIKNRYGLAGELIGIDKRDKNFEDCETQKSMGIKLIVMDASEKLDFPDNSFDFIFHKDSLECIKDIDKHIMDLYRILKPKGQIVCVHRDWESVVFNGRNKELINKAIYGYANFLQSGWMDGCDGWMGRRLFGKFNKTGLFAGSIDCYNEIDTEYEPDTRGYGYINEMKWFTGPDGFLSQAEYDELKGDAAETYKDGEYIFSMPFYIYKGIKI